MAEVERHVVLLSMTNGTDPAAMGAKLCYSGATIDDLREKIDTEDQRAFIEKLEAIGHESPFEHVSFTFGIEGVSRALLAQITRHRLASFSVQSQRYVSYKDGFGFIIPPRIKKLGPDAEVRFCNQMRKMHEWYCEWQEELGKDGNEDARFVLPNACETRMVVTMNARELRHFLYLRMCNRAQWEIRDLADEMFMAVYRVAPALFENAGPGCCCKGCPEGKKCCGHPRVNEVDAMKRFINTVRDAMCVSKEE